VTEIGWPTQLASKTGAFSATWKQNRPGRASVRSFSELLSHEPTFRDERAGQYLCRFNQNQI
jgi:hypothetical protein